MGQGYTRNDTSNNIADGNIINASDLDGEFDAVEAAFNSSAGHTHDGTTAEGGPITVMGPVQDFVVSTTEIKPKTTNTLDIGTGSLQFKDLYLDGTANIDSLVADTANIDGGTIDGTTIGASSAAAITGTTITGTSFVSSGDMTFGDNNKAVFGDSSEFQIYHTDSGNTVLSETGGGDLFIDATNLNLRNSTSGGEYYLTAVSDGAVTLYHNNSAKLATTSSGIDVTGTVTADRLLSIDTTGTNYSIIENKGAGALKDTLVLRNFSNNSGTGAKLIFAPTINDATIRHSAIAGVQNGSNNIDMRFYTSAGTDPVERMRIKQNGDISFYDSTGTTQGLYWDASAESLGIGTTSPDFALDVPAGIGINEGNVLAWHDGSGGKSFDIYASSDNSLRFRVTGSSEAMRIDSSGNVGIGTSSPNNSLHVYHATVNNVALFESGDSRSEISLKDNAGQVYIGNEGDDLRFLVTSGGDEAMRIDSSGRVGIGVSDPANYVWANNIDLVVGNTSGSSGLSIVSSTAGGASIAFADGTTGDERYRGYIFYNHASDYMSYWTAATERMRIDSSGNLLVGKTSSSLSSAGVEAKSDGSLVATRDSNQPVLFNRTGNDGPIVGFYQDGSFVGAIGVDSGDNLYITGQTGDTGGIYMNATSVYPAYQGSGRDNYYDLGELTVRWDDVYATNGTIQTSDANEKQDIEELSDAEQRVAVAAKGLLRKYRWKSSVAEKGDEARIHFGIIAQDLKAAFEAEGLDAGRYAMFINSEWTDEETGEPRSRMGVRYNQLLAFIIAAI